MKIEHGIPIPPKSDVPLEKSFPELLQLQPGDSFVIPRKAFVSHISIALWGVKHHQEHEVRQLGDGDYRVWRTQ